MGNIMANEFINAKNESRLAEIDSMIKELFQRKKKIEKQWKAEKKLIEKIKLINEEIDKKKSLADEFEKNGELAQVAEIRYGLLLELQQDLNSQKENLNQIQKGKKLMNEIVNTEDIAQIAADWTGIPVSKMLETEKMKLVNMEDRLHQRVISQEEAVTAISNAIRRSRAGLQDEARPIGSFIFLGTTGVGKTEMARALAEFLFDDERAIARFDMSEYSEKHSVSRLIGAPPGYVGYEQGGQLTEMIRSKPYSVLLLDEIEKAHPEIFNILLQILEDGRLTDGKGRTVNFKNTVVIMTSNLGSEFFVDAINQGIDIADKKNFGEISNNVLDLLKKTLRPEFINRIDDLIVFKTLSNKDISKIVDLQLKRLEFKLEKQDINLVISDEAKNLIAEKGFDIQNGARPLKRVIQSHITDYLSIKILDGFLLSGDNMYIDTNKNNEFVFSKNTAALFNNE